MKILDYLRASLAAMLLLTLTLPLTATRTEAQGVEREKIPYNWKNVAVGGAGCWVTGVVVHPKAPHATYIRTDVGGSYRWDEAKQSWTPLNLNFDYAHANYYGIESIALDPNQADVVYIAAGTYTDKGDGAIFKSANRGASWTKLGLAVPMGANQEQRWGGERLAVSPRDGRVLLFGSRRDGLWRSVDGGENWTKNSQIPVAADNLGVSAVTFDAKGNGAIYAAVSGQGVYHSGDDGATWSLQPDSPPDVLRLESAPDGALWATHKTGVSKWSEGKWQPLPTGGTPPFCGIAINPHDARDVVVSDLVDRFKAPDGGRLFRTRDGGATWLLVPAANEIGVPWGYQFDIANISALSFDPEDATRMWAVSGAGTMRADNWGAPKATFKSIVAGHEEACINMLAAPPKGTELFSAMLDLDGFAHDNGLDAYPSRRLGMKSGNWIGHTLSIAYQEADPKNMMRIGTQGFAGRAASVAVSRDGGLTWNGLPNFPARTLPLHGAIASNDANNMLVMCNANVSSDEKQWKPVAVEQPFQFTRDGGASWQASAGVPRTAAAAPWGVYGTATRIGADPLAANTFYVAAPEDGAIYRSTDGGAKFVLVNHAKLADLNRAQFKVQPGATGQLWLSSTQDSSYSHASQRLESEGLYHSPDGGASWRKIAGVASVINFGFGINAPNSAVATLFIYGRLTGDQSDKIYRLTDAGENWTDITDPANPVGNQPLSMEGSRQTFGRVFIGTNGSGLFYGDSTR